MAEFIMIAPAGWIDMEFVNAGMYGGLTAGMLDQYITTHNFGELETAFKDAGKFPDGMNNLKDIKFIDAQYLWAIFE
jgi:hypothetical protein